MDHSRINQLVEQSRNNDTAAFAELVAETRRFAYGSVLRFTGDPEESRDIVQEAYIRVWTNLYRFNGKVTFHTWLFSILRNLSIDSIRRNRRRQLAAGPGLPESDWKDPGVIFESAELGTLIRDWIPTLPETQQLVFMLRDMDELSIREVQDQTGLTESSIKSNLYLARKKLAGHLKKKGYQPK